MQVKKIYVLWSKAETHRTHRFLREVRLANWKPIEPDSPRPARFLITSNKTQCKQENTACNQRVSIVSISVENEYTRQTHNPVTAEPEQTTPYKDCPHGSTRFGLQPVSRGGEPRELYMSWRAETVHRASKMLITL